MNNNHPIEGMMDTTLEKIKEMTDSNAVVGDPITSPDGTVIIPISKISYGFVSGGSDLPSKNQPNKDLFGGGAGAGVTIAPMAFIVISNGESKLLQVDPFHSSLDRVISMVPDLMDRFGGLLKKKRGEKEIKVENSETAAQATVEVKEEEG